jgi:hypothetical protein
MGVIYRDDQLIIPIFIYIIPMRSLKLLTFCCLLCGNVFAQTPKNVEADLLKTFKKITYWSDYKGDASVNTTDSLYKANGTFGKMLKGFTEKYPFTIHEPFDSLRKERLDIATAADSLFRIYSWDMLSGGTMHFFANVFQYKVGNKTYALLDQPLGEGDNSPSYHKLFLLKAGNKTYYLAVFVWVGSTKDFSRGIQVFAIENGKLNSDVKLIKTKSGLHNTLSYEYDIAVSDSNIDTDIHYDGLTQTIKFPLVTGNGKVTNKLITYKFNGKYFEKVSNLAK